MSSLVPLDLFAEIITASGARYKWDANQPSGSRPQNLSFRTKIGEGFSDASLQLARRIDQDYADLNLVDGLVLTGADGSIAYEGRNAAMPRDLSDTHSISVTFAGWMAHAKDRKFADVFTDRDTGQWGAPSAARKAAILAASTSLGDFDYAADQGSLTVALPNQALGTLTLAEAWYAPPPDVLIASVGYRGKATTLPAGYVQNFFAADTRTSGFSGVAPTLDDTLRTAAMATAKRYVMHQLTSNGTAATPAAGSSIQFSKLAAYGNHGLTLRTGDPAEPDGIWLSDIIKNIAQRFCPLLDTSGVQDNAYVVQHCAYRDRTFPYDAFLDLNKYALWHLGVWDNRQLVYRPYDLTDYDWEIRTDDPGTTFSPQGPSTEDLFNGIAVTYTDPLTGVPDTLTPDTTSALSDTSTSNPWNQHGIAKWNEITLSSPTLAAQASSLGQAALADSNRPRTPGTITVRGYIRDRAGNKQPCWKVRAGDTISITNFPNDSPRLIVETDYDDESKQVRLSIDRPFALLDAYLDRLANGLGGAGLG
jgi:hypothetical protein